MFCNRIRACGRADVSARRMSNQCRGMLPLSKSRVPPPHYKCAKCGVPGHYVNDCPESTSNNCGRKGHSSTACERMASASWAADRRVAPGVGIVPTDILAQAVAHAKASAAAAATATVAGRGRGEEVSLVEALAHAKATAARLGALTSAKRNAEAAAAASEQAIPPTLSHPSLHLTLYANF